MAVAKWTVWVEAARPDGTTERIEIATLERDLSSHDPGDLGLRLAETKDLLHALQAHLVQNQVQQLSAIERPCSSCGSRRSLHDYRRRQVDTLFGRVALRQPRWRPCVCQQTEVQRKPGTNDPSRMSALIGARATQELVRVQAELGARLSYQEAARVMRVLLPTSTATKEPSGNNRIRLTAERCGDSRPSKSLLSWLNDRPNADSGALCVPVTAS